MKKIVGVSSAILTSLSVSAYASNVDISDLDKKDLVRALFAEAKPQGLSVRKYNKDDVLTEDDLLALEKMGWSLDYLKGRVMKIDFSGNEFDTQLYNRDNGTDKAEKIIAMLRKKKSKE